MNAQIQAISAALAINTDEGEDQLHRVLVNRSQRLRQVIDKITGAVDNREDKYDRIKELRTEMDGAMDHIINDGETGEYRPVTQIAAELKRVNDSLDKDIEKVYDLISEADALRDEIHDLVQMIAEIPLVATAA